MTAAKRTRSTNSKKKMNLSKRWKRTSGLFRAGSFALAFAIIGSVFYLLTHAVQQSPATCTGPCLSIGAAGSAGYWVMDPTGGVFAYNSQFYNSVPGVNVHINNAVTLVPTSDQKGYWIFGSDGGVYAFGDAQFKNSLPGLGVHPNCPVVGGAALPTNDGYWMVGCDGGIFGLGNVSNYGNLANQHLNAPIVGMATTTDGKGYWLVGADGGVFAFGDAPYLGGTPAGINPTGSNKIVGIARAGNSNNYWLAGADGGIFSYGPGIGFYNSMAGQHLNAPIVGIASTPTGAGYYLLGSDGGLFAFGDAVFNGHPTSTNPTPTPTSPQPAPQPVAKPPANTTNTTSPTPTTPTNTAQPAAGTPPKPAVNNTQVTYVETSLLGNSNVSKASVDFVGANLLRCSAIVFQANYPQDTCVGVIQTILYNKGLYAGALDSIFGPHGSLTEQGVIKLQCEFIGVSDGIVGPATWGFLVSPQNPGKVCPAPVVTTHSIAPQVRGASGCSISDPSCGGTPTAQLTPGQASSQAASLPNKNTLPGTLTEHNTCTEASTYCGVFWTNSQGQITDQNGNVL